MENLPLEIKATIQVLKPAEEVFEAIVDPVKMSNYFISESSGRMEEGKNLTWKWPEFEEAASVRVGKTEPGKYITFNWDGKDTEQTVEITLAAKNSNTSTLITVTEKTVKGIANIDWLKGNTEGWANFLACLKAYMEYGINLRKGAYLCLPERLPRTAS